MTSLFEFTSKQCLDKEMMKFSLSLYSNPLISREAVDNILNSTNNFVSNYFIPYLQTEISTQLKSHVSLETYSKIIFILNNGKGLFQDFSSEHRRFNLFSQKSLYVAPESFFIGKVDDFNKKTGRTEKKCTHRTSLYLKL